MDRFAVRFAVGEALSNALLHAHHNDPAKVVRLGFLVMPDYVLAEVTDQGNGFDPAQVPNPMVDADPPRETGRGIFMMRLMMSWIRFDCQGRRVTMCKMRSNVTPQSSNRNRTA
jgi:serine/threonine-protein kinase RsbW